MKDKLGKVVLLDDTIAYASLSLTNDLIPCALLKIGTVIQVSNNNYIKVRFGGPLSEIAEINNNEFIIINFNDDSLQKSLERFVSPLVV